jgi:hypothetical protein
MKFFDYASSVEVKFDRDHHTRHGLHLNTKGNAHSVKLLMTAINGIFKKSKMTPISVIWNERQEVSVNRNTDKIKEQDGRQGAMDLPTQSDEKTAGPLNWKDEQVVEETMIYKNKDCNNCQEDEEAVILSEEMQTGSTLNRLHVKQLRRPPSNRRDDFLW